MLGCGNCGTSLKACCSAGLTMTCNLQTLSQEQKALERRPDVWQSALMVPVNATTSFHCQAGHEKCAWPSPGDSVHVLPVAPRHASCLLASDLQMLIHSAALRTEVKDLERCSFEHRHMCAHSLQGMIALQCRVGVSAVARGLMECMPRMN